MCTRVQPCFYAHARYHCTRVCEPVHAHSPTTHTCIVVSTHSHTCALMHAQLRQAAAPKKRTPRSRSAPSRERPDPSRNAPIRIRAPPTMTKTNKAQTQAVAGSVQTIPDQSKVHQHTGLTRSQLKGRVAKMPHISSDTTTECASFSVPAKPASAEVTTSTEIRHSPGHTPTCDSTPSPQNINGVAANSEIRHLIADSSSTDTSSVVVSIERDVWM